MLGDDDVGGATTGFEEEDVGGAVFLEEPVEDCSVVSTAADVGAETTMGADGPDAAPPLLKSEDLSAFSSPEMQVLPTSVDDGS